MAIDRLKSLQRGALQELRLDRPEALNAISAEMFSTVTAAIPRIARNPDIYAVAITSALPNVFCAGGDVREMVEIARRDPVAALASFARECATYWTLECFSKPAVALIDGLVMGSGVGLTLYATHRVAGPRYAFMMPEAGIGLFPDVGIAHRFARLSGEMGTFLALTGHRIGRADAFRLGLVTHCIADDRFEEVLAALAEAMPVDPLLDALHADPGEGELSRYEETIARCFAGPTIEDIIARLDGESGPSREWAQGIAAGLGRAAPLSLKATLEHVRRAAGLDLRQTLIIDHRLARHFLAKPDFAEGIRAVLVDRDRRPQWRPARLEDVSPAMVDRLFLADPASALMLPTRQEMQALRV